MIIELIVYGITFLFLFIGSYTDLRTREVPDWINYGSICFGILFNLLASVLFHDYSYIINSVVGFFAFLLLGYFMFYTGQWGGGDSKAIMGIGALLGLDISFKQFPFILSFFINILIVGALYGLLWSIALAFKNRKNFSKEFKKVYYNPGLKIIKIAIIVLSVFIIFILLDFFDTSSKYSFLWSIFFLLFAFFLWIFVKAVEKSCMIKYVKPQQLTEGDWILKDIRIDGKTITGPKDLGVSKKQIRQLTQFYKRGRIKTVAIKEGIPFVPSFFIAFILTVILLYAVPSSLGNVIFWFAF